LKERYSYSYTKKFGGTEYTVEVTENPAAKFTAEQKLKRLLIKDLSDKVYSGGETHE